MTIHSGVVLKLMDDLIGGPGADRLDGGEDVDEEDDMVPTLGDDGEPTGDDRSET